jgi:hypothetical protein
MSKEMDQYEASRNIVVDSAVESLELQHLTVDELRPYCQLTPINLYDSAIVNHTHLLATSVLCFYIRYLRDTIELDRLSKIQTLLRGTQAIWNRSSNLSVEARRAADALSTVLETLEETTRAPEPEEMSQEDRGTTIQLAEASLLDDDLSVLLRPLQLASTALHVWQCKLRQSFANASRRWRCVFVPTIYFTHGFVGYIHVKPPDVFIKSLGAHHPSINSTRGLLFYGFQS